MSVSNKENIEVDFPKDIRCDLDDKENEERLFNEYYA